ncbi:hypothetical protein FEA48_30760 [Pseudomonas nitroreducens]|uniref:Uncharacterized protein n=1 Tax=Pseudomonas nitroreducens TaxID=46680 RepID=A0A5R8ZQ26_PSENT|nr:hypothetical protein [Pseudomonas nitroreducens]TLP68237.1 hypothetical protein FEA48_30760 [Pseudomonas nitroreducens]
MTEVTSLTLGGYDPQKHQVVGFDAASGAPFKMALPTITQITAVNASGDIVPAGALVEVMQGYSDGESSEPTGFVPYSTYSITPQVGLLDSETAADAEGAIRVGGVVDLTTIPGWTENVASNYTCGMPLCVGRKSDGTAWLVSLYSLYPQEPGTTEWSRQFDVIGVLLGDGEDTDLHGKALLSGNRQRFSLPADTAENGVSGEYLYQTDPVTGFVSLLPTSSIPAPVPLPEQSYIADIEVHDSLTPAQTTQSFRKVELFDRDYDWDAGSAVPLTGFKRMGKYGYLTPVGEPATSGYFTQFDGMYSSLQLTIGGAEADGKGVAYVGYSLVDIGRLFRWDIETSFSLQVDFSLPQVASFQLWIGWAVCAPDEFVPGTTPFIGVKTGMGGDFTPKIVAGPWSRPSYPAEVDLPLSCFVADGGAGAPKLNPLSANIYGNPQRPLLNSIKLTANADNVYVNSLLENTYTQVSFDRSKVEADTDSWYPVVAFLKHGNENSGQNDLVLLDLKFETSFNFAGPVA